MNLDLILYIVFFIPLFIVGYKKDRLIEKQYFMRWLTLSLVILLIGILYEYYQGNKLSKGYFGSQLLLIFLIVNKISRNIYFKIYKREPEFGQFPEHKVDYIYSFIIIISIMVLPFLINDFIVKKIINYVNKR